MARFITFAESITAVGSTDPVGMRDMNASDDRGVLQIDSSLGSLFGVRMFGTARYDFTTNLAISDWQDITDRFRPEGDQSSDFVLVGGVWQKRKETTQGLPLDVAGMYALDDGFFPEAIYAGILTAPESGHLDLHFGF
jgi:hypothetical protein